MTRARVLLFLSLFLSISFCSAGDRPTFQFLQSDMTARSAAMAGSYVSMQDDPSGMFSNPATIATLGRNSTSIGYTSHLLDIKAGSLAYGQRYEEIGTIGVGVQYVNYGTMDGRNEQGIETGTFTAGDIAVSSTLAGMLDENLYYGVTGKYIHSSIAEASSSALAADVGLMYLIPGDDPIALGISLTNMGKQFDAFVDTTESLPFELRVGGTIKPAHLPLQLNINFRRLTEERNNFFDRFTAFTVGGEFTLSKALRFRFGYDNDLRKQLKIGTSAGMAGFSLGGGLVVKGVRFDYAYSSLGEIGAISRITIGLDL